MPGSYPEVVRTYFSAFDRRDLDALTECFADGATVTDAGRTHRGRDEIRAWRESAGIGYEYVVEVVDAVDDGADTFLVDTNVVSTTSGEPIGLKFRFTLGGQLIKDLQIAP